VAAPGVTIRPKTTDLSGTGIRSDRTSCSALGLTVSWRHETAAQNGGYLKRFEHYAW
jgi:hypothetical protein